MIHNPVIRGFHPDPSIVRVGEDYYIATSTFEYFPGVEIHHSRDLAHWRLLARPLDRPSLLDLTGVGASQGVWAPDLTWHDGLFYLAYTVVRSFYCNMYDTHNYVTTAPAVTGPWTEPVRLNGYGFDPSLFHDADGRLYMVCMVTDHRVPRRYAGRIVLQELCARTLAPLGDVREIYAADPIYLEGPHLYWHGGWYYLFAADTGTGELHGQSVLRAASVWGPYTMFQPPFAERTDEREAYSVLTSRHHPGHPLQKAGHAALVDTPQGDWYAAHLCGRPSQRRNPPDAPRFAGARRYPLGRETCIQRMAWVDGWPVPAQGNALPAVTVETPGLPDCPWPALPERDDFTGETLALCWQYLRLPPAKGDCTLTQRPGWLRLRGGEGLASRFAQSMVLQRLTEPDGWLETRVDFLPRVFKQMAGLILWYDNDNYLYLHVTHDEQLGRVVTLLTAENKRYAYPVGFLPVSGNATVGLRVTLSGGDARCAYAVGDGPWQTLDAVFDATALSDEACAEGWFTGSMGGVCCQDLTGGRLPADFDYFTYHPEAADSATDSAARADE